MAALYKYVFDVQVDYGAKGDGTTDDTTSIQNALNAAKVAGGTVYFPIGVYKVTSALTLLGAVGVTLRGDSGGKSIIRSNQATGDTLQIGNNGATQSQYITIEKLQFSPSVVKTAGTEIKLTNLFACTLRDVYTDKNGTNVPYNGLVVLGGANTYDLVIENCRFVNGANNGMQIGDSGGSTTSVQGVYMVKVDCGGNTQSGMVLYNISGLSMQYAEFLLNGQHGIVTYPGTGQAVKFVQATQLNCDTNTSSGLALYENGGTVEDLQFGDSWFSSNGDHGVVTASSTGIDGANFVNARFVNNNKYGALLQSATKNFIFNGCAFEANSQGANNTYSGLVIYNGVTDVLVHGCSSGAQGFGTASNPQKYGFFVGTGCTNVVHRGCWAHGNQTGDYNINTAPPTVSATANANTNANGGNI